MFTPSLPQRSMVDMVDIFNMLVMVEGGGDKILLVLNFTKYSSVYIMQPLMFTPSLLPKVKGRHGGHHAGHGGHG